MRRFLRTLILTMTLGVIPYFTLLTHATSDDRYYPIGTPTLQSIWVDPVAGDDQNTGGSRATAKRTLVAAWELIPADTTFTTGYQILLTPGTYTSSDMPSQWTNRHGSAQFPIVLTASDGANTATISSTLTLSDIDYFYLTNLTVTPNSGGAAIHCSRCNYFLLKNMTIVAAPDSVDTPSLSVSQSHYVYLEESDVSGAVTYNAVQYGHIYNNHLHDASNDCLSTGTGSALLTIEANHIDMCGGSGYVAGQNSGFEDMQAPWLHYDAYDIKFRNNIITNTQSAGMSVSAGYNVLLANNTLYNIGVNTAPITVKLGQRLCISDVLACGANIAQRGWGTTQRSGDGIAIPNRNVYIFNNIILNPLNSNSTQHIIVDAAKSTNNASQIPSPSRADDNLRIVGNIWWNGPTDLPMGVGGSQGCSDSNLTCNNTIIRANNRINTLQPQFTNVETADFHPRNGGNLTGITSVVIPDFPDNRPAPPQAPLGDLHNLVIRDIANTLRQNDAPGAYAYAIDIATITPIASATNTATRTQATSTLTRTPTISVTPSISRTPTRSVTPSISRTPTISVTPSISRSATITRTPRATATNTRTASITRTASATITLTPIEAVPIIPKIDAITKSILIQVHRKGLDMGNRENTFAKVGDSITASDSFLMDIGCGGENLADYQSLQTTITYFRKLQFTPIYGTGWCHVSNSFNMNSPSAQSGWSAYYALDSNWLYTPYKHECTYPYNIPIACEFKITRPSIVFIMFGSNDSNHIYTQPSDFQFTLNDLIATSLDNGIIPVLSTIPPRTNNSFASSRVQMFNTVIINVAKKQHIPLWNYWLALQSPSMIHFGISDDNVHPSVYRGNQSADFSREGLRYGYNQRNLQALQILDSIRRIVFENGPPDAP